MYTIVMLYPLSLYPSTCSSLDVIIDKLGGPSKVAEMTGRRARIVRNAAGKAQYEMRQTTCISDQSLNVKEVLIIPHALF